MGFIPTRNRKFQKNSKTIQIIRKHHHSLFPCKNRLGKAENDRKKKKKSFRCVPIRLVIENSKKIIKKFKKLENTIIASFHAKIGWEMPRKSENENNRSKGFQPDPELKIPKK